MCRSIIARATAVFLLSAVGIFAQSAPAGRLASQGRHWRCEPKQKWECELPTGCRPLDGEPSWVLLDLATSTYQRCDRFGCNKYSMLVQERGLFAYVTLPDHPDMFLKIGSSNYFIETASIGVSAINSMGTCRVQN